MKGSQLTKNRQTIMLTGGAGYIGSHTAVVLLEAGYDVVVYDNFHNSSRDVLHVVESLADKKIETVEADVLDCDSLVHALRSYEVSGVIHFAGIKVVPDSLVNPLLYYHQNVAGSLSLMKAMQQSNVRNLIFSSSASVYGDPIYLPVDEKHPLCPSTPYGRSKRMVETILEDICCAFGDWKVINLRYFNPMGAHPSGLIGEKTDSSAHNLMSAVSSVIVKKANKLPVLGNDFPTVDGTGVRDFIHIMDLAEGHRAALDLLMDASNHGHNFESINLGTGNGYSVFEIVEAFRHASGLSIPVEILSRREGDVASCFADVNYASEILGWSSARSLDDICSSAWKFLVTNCR